VQYAWRHARLDAAHNLGRTLLSSSDEWGKLGPLANETLDEVRNRGAAERRKPEGTNNDARRRGEDNRDARDHRERELEGHDDQTKPHSTLTSQEWREAMAKAIAEAEAKGTLDEFEENDDRVQHQ
jgi:hypothetical protein